MNTDVPRILTFWFGTADAPHGSERWFRPDTNFDKEIKIGFGDLVVEARNEKSSLDGWTETPEGALALLILLDQFPRNIYRNSPDAFASDAKAVNVTVQAIAKGFDRAVEPVRQAFFYTPLMHDENLLSQIAAVACYEGMAFREEEGSQGKESATTSLGFARKHMDVIRAFGRFPSRNTILGRESTVEEAEYSKGHPGGF
ncbi:MAG: hypothetical protein ALECFALPRED_009618 [Alectoria fallacina]|uniref:DUF924 domain-containing protein n=1 Tax=Alectoria fallacina TaxID=1903189 RepID=A0A8H3J825_9LECA|nr:MAG: hypothetical protein ALECFALPRED_009618 [Alectoria fallacina]